MSAVRRRDRSSGRPTLTHIFYRSSSIQHPESRIQNPHFTFHALIAPACRAEVGRRGESDEGGSRTFPFHSPPLFSKLPSTMQKADALAFLRQMLGPAADFRDGQWEAI